MLAYPVHFAVKAPGRVTPVQLGVRLVAFIVLGTLGLSFGTIFTIAYVALPTYAAARLASLGSADAYLREDGPRIQVLLRWLASVSAWAGLVADRLPVESPDELLTLSIDDAAARPTATAALLRIVTGLPSALVLMVLGAIGVLVWIWAALSILSARRIGPQAFEYLVGLQRWSVRLLAYQACLVDAYPPFSFTDTPAKPATGEALGGSVAAR